MENALVSANKEQQNLPNEENKYNFNQNNQYEEEEDVKDKEIKKEENNENNENKENNENEVDAEEEKKREMFEADQRLIFWKEFLDSKTVLERKKALILKLK